MLNPALVTWLEQHADALHTGHLDLSLALLPQLGDADIFRHGVLQIYAGCGGQLSAAIEHIAALAEYSLCAAFVACSQRTYIECLLAAAPDLLKQHRFAALLAGQYAGAVGLSNAIKFLAGIEQLQIQATQTASGWCLNGELPWVTNFHPHGFSVVVAAATDQGPKLFLVPSDRAGFQRHPDLAFIGLAGSSTASASLKEVMVSADDVLSQDAKSDLRHIRPAFIGLQCGLAIGLSRRCFKQIHSYKHSTLLHQRVRSLEQQLREQVTLLYQGIKYQYFVAQPELLFQVRIALSDLSQQAIQLELMHAGEQCDLQALATSFTRRLTESALIPIIRPSILQLKTELSQLSQKVS